MDSFYSIVNNYTDLVSASGGSEEQWNKVDFYFDHMRSVLLEDKANKYLDTDMLKKCCTLPSDMENLARLLDEPAKPLD